MLESLTPKNGAPNYERIPLPDEENAFPLWREAGKYNVEFEESSAREEEEDACLPNGSRKTWADEAPGLPNDEEGARMLVAIEQNRRALDLAAQGVARGRCQFPEIPTPQHWNVGIDVLQSMRNLGRMRFLRIRHLAGQERHTEAAGDAVCLLHLGDLICTGEGVGVHYLMGICYRSMGIDAIWFVARQQPDENALRRLLSGVEASLAQEDGLATSMMVDFWRVTYPHFEALPDNLELEPLVDYLLEKHFNNSILSFLDEDNPIDNAEERTAWRRQCLLEALRDHPQPLDKAFTLHTVRQRFAESHAEVLNPTNRVGWRRRLKNAWRKRSSERWMTMWPHQLSPYCPLKHLGESEEAQADLAEFATLLADMRWSRSHYRPLTLDKIDVLRRRLRRVRNPLGRMLLEYGGDVMSRKWIATRSRLDRTAVQTVLALQLYQCLHGRLPESIDDLVREQILATPPVDPNSGRALRYCRMRAVVWSVGADGKNRRGDLEYETDFPVRKLRWEVPLPR